MEGQKTILEPPESLPANQEGTPGREREKRSHAFTFDHSYWSAGLPTDEDYASQHTLFEDLGKPIVDDALKGYNTCIFAYGQTGSGKSFTMMGYNNDKGIIPLTTSELFTRISTLQSEAPTSEPTSQFQIEVSYIEIYNEKVRDLLNPKNSGPLKVREHPRLGPYVEGLSKLVVMSFEEVMTLMDEGNQHRVVAATQMNETSSRSHAVFTLTLTQKKHDAATKLDSEKVAKISLVDLAGSERANATGATGARLKEGANINRSLTTLGKVIQALAAASSDTKGKKKKDDFVPYRDSTLTWLLKESLGGNSKTCMIAAISPADYEETLSTLRYADQAKQIRTNAVVNEDPNAKLIRELKEELEVLRIRASSASTNSSGESTFDPNIPPEKQIVTYKSRSGEIKTVTKLELQENMEATEKLMVSLNESWEEKMQKTAAISAEREKALEALGISVDKDQTIVGVKVPRGCSIVNLNEDPLMSECLVYQLKEGRTLVGSGEEATIRLSGSEKLCAFEHSSDNVQLEAISDGCLINGKPLAVGSKTNLESGYRLILGSHVFRFSFPEAVRQKIQASRPERAESPYPTLADKSEDSPQPIIDWSFAKREAALARLAGKSGIDQISLVDLKDEDLDELFDDIIKVKTSRQRPDSRAGGTLPKSISDWDMRRRHVSAAMTADTSGDTSANPWSGEPIATSMSTPVFSHEIVKDDGGSEDLDAPTRDHNSWKLSPRVLSARIEAEERKIMEQQMIRVGQEVKLLRKDAAQANAHKTPLGFDNRPLDAYHARLARKVVDQWRRCRAVAMAQKVLRTAVQLKEANVMARQNQVDVVYNFVVQDGPATVSILDEGLGGIGFDSEASSAMTLQSGIPLIGVEVNDREANSVYVWDMDNKFKGQLQRMRGIKRRGKRQSISNHFTDQAAFVDTPPPAFTLVGTTLVPLNPVLSRRSATYTLPIYCRITSEARGTCRVAFNFDQPSRLSLSLDSVKGFTSVDLFELHAQFRLSSFVGDFQADETVSSNLVDLQKTSTTHLKLKRDIRLPDDTEPGQEYAYVEFYGKATTEYLKSLTRWQISREVIPSSLGNGGTLTPPRPSMRRNETEFAADHLHHIVAALQIQELTSSGTYQPVEIRSSPTEPEIFQLHQGVQRRLLLRLSHNSARSLDWLGLSYVDVSDLRVVRKDDINRDEPKVVSLKTLGRSQIQYKPDGTATLAITCVWDTSAHDTPHLDTKTSAQDYLILRLTYQVELACTDEPAVFTQDFNVKILSRDAGSSSSVVGYFTSTKLANQTSTLYTLKLAPPLSKEKIWQLDTSGKHVDGEEELGDWRPRSPTLIEDYLSLRSLARRIADVQVTKEVLESLPYSPVTSVRSEGWERELLERCVDAWKGVVATAYKFEIKRESPEHAEILAKIREKIPDITPKFLTSVKPMSLGKIAKKGHIFVLLDSSANTWERRWAVLQRPFLRMYTSSKETVECAAICLTDAAIKESPDVVALLERQYAFTIFALTNTTILHTTTQKELHEWLTALRIH